MIFFFRLLLHQVPLQDNESDCGLFLLHYIQKFVEYAPKTLKSRDLDGNWENLGVVKLLSNLYDQPISKLNWLFKGGGSSIRL